MPKTTKKARKGAAKSKKKLKSTAKAATKKTSKKGAKVTKKKAAAKTPKGKAVKAKSSAGAHPRYLVIDSGDAQVSTTRELTPHLRDKAKHGLVHIVDAERMLAMTPMGAWAKIEDVANVKESAETTAAWSQVLKDRESAAAEVAKASPAPTPAAEAAPSRPLVGATAEAPNRPASQVQEVTAREDEDEEVRAGASVSAPINAPYQGVSQGFAAGDGALHQ